MKIMKKEAILFIVVLLFVGPVTGIWYYRNYVRIQNVFDQIVQTGFGHVPVPGLRAIRRERPPFSTFGDRFRNVGLAAAHYQGSGLGENRRIAFWFSESGSGVEIHFTQEFPDTDEELLLMYSYRVRTRELQRRSISIRSSLYHTEYILRNWGSQEAYDEFLQRNNFDLERSHEVLASFSDRDASDIINDFLTRHNLTRAEIEDLHHWFLFEYFLPRWYETTQSSTRFSPNNWGKFTLIDELAD